MSPTDDDLSRLADRVGSFVNNGPFLGGGDRPDPAAEESVRTELLAELRKAEVLARRLCEVRQK